MMIDVMKAEDIYPGQMTVKYVLHKNKYNKGNVTKDWLHKALCQNMHIQQDLL